MGGGGFEYNNIEIFEILLAKVRFEKFEFFIYKDFYEKNYVNAGFNSHFSNEQCKC